jgi:two-component system, chemotaxis family, sensor kinase CheA
MTTMMDDETLQIFLEEAKEHLETIESDLLTIEEQGSQLDEEIVNKVFRAAHSLKGGAGFLGLTTIKELAHKLESVLQMVRSAELQPTSTVIEPVLAGFDRLRELLNHPEESNTMDIEDQVVGLNRLISEALPADSRQTLHTSSTIAHSDLNIHFSIDSFTLNQARQGGKYLYILYLDLIRDIEARQITQSDFLRKLEDTGVILDIRLDLAAAGDLDSAELTRMLPLTVLFASIVEPDLVGVLLEIDEKQVFQVTDEMISAPKQTKEATTVVEIGVAPPEPVSKPSPSVPSIQKKRSDPPPTAAPPSKTPPSVPKPSQSDVGPSSELRSSPTRGQELKSESLRVNVRVLDQLMNRAGELVLARNQLLQSLLTDDRQNIGAASQRINLVTSELQETIMLTRMQPLGIIFNKFPRVVRDLARELDKQIELEMVGKEVELDKTIIESLGDPLTHLVRNSLDHGIEMPEVRKKLGKAPTGTITLKASYASGQVVIEIQDDGQGLDSDRIAAKAVEKGLYSADEIAGLSEKEKTQLIMLPGFSTAEKVTDISGRGVGMDVVKTNLDAIGGQIEIDSERHRGTTIRIKLPLTLAIIPSLLVSSGQERFALPQVNVGELIRVPAAEVRQRVEKIGGADVFILRNELIPLLQLNNILEQAKTFYDFKTGTFRPDRREGVGDDRLFNPLSADPATDAQEPLADSTESAQEYPAESLEDKNERLRKTRERRSGRANDIIIVVVDEGSFRYGLLVDAVHDTIEIVVKPLGSFLKKCGVYAGATIMGDGKVALILDVLGLARKAELRSMADVKSSTVLAAESDRKTDEAARQTLLLFHNGPGEYCAVPLYQVLRVEMILTSTIEIRAGLKVIQYRNGHLPVYALEEVANVGMIEEREKLIVIIFNVAGREVGLLAVPPLDVIEAELVLDETTLKQPGISGSTIIRDRTTLMVDIYSIMEALNPQWFRAAPTQTMPTAIIDEMPVEDEQKILLVEDSEFFRSQVRRFIEEGEYTVVEAEDGRIAWNYLQTHHTEIRLVVTDIEMPNMNGFELSRKIKDHPDMAHLTIIALTSLASEEDKARGNEAGIDDYQIKLDKTKLLESIQHYLS